MIAIFLFRIACLAQIVRLGYRWPMGWTVMRTFLSWAGISRFTIERSLKHGTTEKCLYWGGIENVLWIGYRPFFTGYRPSISCLCGSEKFRIFDLVWFELNQELKDIKILFWLLFVCLFGFGLFCFVYLLLVVVLFVYLFCCQSNNNTIIYV